MSTHQNGFLAPSMKEPTLKTRREAIRQSLSLPLAAKLSILATTGAWLSGCGGGDDPPTVSLAVTPTTGREGDAISLSVQAEADSDLSIAEVSFYRVTDSADILLATFVSSPYLLQTTIPTGTAGTTIQYGARATDSDGQTTNSVLVAVTVSS
jgi:hypothetical protein